MKSIGKILFVLLVSIESIVCASWGQTTERKTAILLKPHISINAQINKNINLYEIREELDLAGERVVLPNECRFIFNGGIIRNGSIDVGCLIVNEWKFENVKINGTVDFAAPINVPVNNTKEFVSTIIEHKPILSDLPTVLFFSANQVYNWDGILKINKRNVTLTGGGTIQGHIHIGLDETTYKNIKFDDYPATAHSNILISNLRFSKHNVIGTLYDSDRIIDYIKAAEPTTDNVAISIINVSNVKIENCFFDNVPFPVVYTPNESFVNQNVRRLNIINCDFEFCHTAVYAPSLVKNSLEYGDLVFSNNNVYPTNYGLDVSCIDGLKVFNNTFNTCKKGQMGANIRALLPGQVVITNNSFYGEYNRESVILDSPGTAIIDGNLFSSQGLVYPPTKKDRMACLQIQRTVKTSYASGLTITNNLFTRVNRLPIYVDGYFRSATIMGNTVSGTRYSLNKSVLYYFHSTSKDETRLQPMKMNDNLLEDITGTLELRMDVINDMMNSNSLYPDEVWKKKKHIYSFKKGNHYIPVSVTGCSKAKPIYVIRPIQSSYNGDVPFVFNGIQFTINVTSITTNIEVLKMIIDELKPVFGDSHQFKIIDDILWIVGNTSDTPVITPMWEINEKSTPYRFQVLYQNLGYNITLKDVDEKNFIGAPLYNYGIDSDDDGKIVKFGNTLTVLRTKSQDKPAELVFHERPEKRASYKWLYNDMFFACGINGTANTAKLLSSIVELCYTDRAHVKGNLLILKEINKEYNFCSYGGEWHSTYDTHVVIPKFFTANGIEYYPDSDNFNNVGPSTFRPNNPKVGFQYFDSTIGRPIYWNGLEWVDSEGHKR